MSKQLGSYAASVSTLLTSDRLLIWKPAGTVLLGALCVVVETGGERVLWEETKFCPPASLRMQDSR